MSETGTSPTWSPIWRRSDRSGPWRRTAQQWRQPDHVDRWPCPAGHRNRTRVPAARRRAGLGAGDDRHAGRRGGPSGQLDDLFRSIRQPAVQPADRHQPRHGGRSATRLGAAARHARAGADLAARRRRGDVHHDPRERGPGARCRHRAGLLVVHPSAGGGAHALLRQAEPRAGHSRRHALSGDDGCAPGGARRRHRERRLGHRRGAAPRRLQHDGGSARGGTTS